MNSRLQEITRRKEHLIEQCARQRDEVAALFRQIRSPFDFGGLGLKVARGLKAHPIVMAGISSLLAGGYAGKLFKLTGECLTLLRLIRPLWLWWKKPR